MSEHLLPCPFCGSPARFYHDQSSDYERQWWWDVECTNDGDCGASVTGAASKAAAQASWNNRQPTPVAYAHRNGETESPTEPGLYWFDGLMYKIKTKVILVVVTEGNVMGWYPYGDRDKIPYGGLRDFAGQWWGPVTPPWGQP